MDSLPSSSGLTAYLTTQVYAAKLEQHEENLALASFLVSLLFVPFGIYFGLVFGLFVLEFYRCVRAWRNAQYSLRAVHESSYPHAWRRAEAVQAQQEASKEKQMNYYKQEIQKQLHIRPYSICEETETNNINNNYDHNDSSSGNNNDNNNNGNNNCECSICFLAFQSRDTVASIRHCHCKCNGISSVDATRTNSSNIYHGHGYHVDCLMEWLLHGKPSCPYCRYQLAPTNYQLRNQHNNGQLQYPTGTTRPITASLELASLQVEHYVMEALNYFGECVTNYAY